jgi:plastocyanin
MRTGHAAAGLFLAAAAHAGEVHGTLKVGGAADADRTVVYLEGVPAGAVPDPKLARMSQKGARFSPVLLPVVRGTTVDMTNDDWVSHSVFSKSAPRPFDLGLYAKGERRTVTFDRKGVIEIFCAIHPRMNAVVLVLENGFFTKPAADGTFSFGEVPAGGYEVHYYRLGGQTAAQKVTVPASGAASVLF